MAETGHLRRPGKAICLIALAFGLLACTKTGLPGRALISQIDTAKLKSDAAEAKDIDPTWYAGDLEMAFSATIPTRLGALPTPIYLGVSSATDTRLGVNAFVDLRHVQAELPQLLTGPLEESCQRDIQVNFDGAAAQGDRVLLSGTVDAAFYRCAAEDSPIEDRGRRRLSQNVDVVAVAQASASGQCINLALLELEVSPSGLLGALANLFGITRRVRDAVLEDAEIYFAANPICPQLPEDFRALAPHYSSGAINEVGPAGIGATLTGTVDTSADTLIQLLEAFRARGAVEGQR